MLTLRDIVTALIGGLLAASVAYAAEGAAGPTTHHAAVHHTKAVSCQLSGNGPAATS